MCKALLFSCVGVLGLGAMYAICVLLAFAIRRGVSMPPEDRLTDERWYAEQAVSNKVWELNGEDAQWGGVLLAAFVGIILVLRLCICGTVDWCFGGVKSALQNRRGETSYAAVAPVDPGPPTERKPAAAQSRLVRY